jgi:hypothetical protein
MMAMIGRPLRSQRGFALTTVTTLGDDSVHSPGDESNEEEASMQLWLFLCRATLSELIPISGVGSRDARENRIHDVEAGIDVGRHCAVLHAETRFVR